MNTELEDTLTARIIGAAISVHRELGPGFLEAVYEEATAVILSEMNLRYLRQVIVPIRFHGRIVGEHRLDLLVEDEVVVELKAVARFEDVHIAVVRSYLRACGANRGLLMNFSTPTLEIKRIGAQFRPRS
jgi:GxxExxY protein